MEVGIIGFGAMGRAMAGHIAKSGSHKTTAFDVDPAQLAGAEDAGVEVRSSLAGLARSADLMIVMVATDAQALAVSAEILPAARAGAVIATASTLHPRTMHEIADQASPRGVGVIDAPVVFGLQGAKDGDLVSLCGGDAAHIEFARPALMCYSRALHHIGPLGHGQLAKAINNMLHWSACVANFEALSLAKCHGMDTQKLREVLYDCPSNSGTLRRWDTTRFTWPEKDMDIALEMAQEKGLTLPLFGQVDQLVKLLSADQIKGLLHGESTTYLGQKISA